MKKVDLGSSFSNLCLISNLSYIAKLTEKVVFKQLNNHLLINKLYPKLQSAYWKFHSTETALLKVTNDSLLNMNSQRVSLLVPLDLSAAFDAIDHFQEQVNKLCKTSFYFLYNIRKIRKYLTKEIRAILFTRLLFLVETIVIA